MNKTPIYLMFLVGLAATPLAAAPAGWPVWGGDDGGTRHAEAARILPGNVMALKEVWRFSTGDMARRGGDVMRNSKFEATPILVGDKLVLCTPFNEAIALDPGTGKPLWRFDPKIRDDYRPANLFTCRGVAAWTDPEAPKGAACSTRILMATNDSRLFALDLATGKPCAGFGNKGEVKVDPGMKLDWPGEFQITSAPTIVGDTVIVGSSISDNVRVDAPTGTIRAFDIRTGAARWTWDPDPGRGHANAWGPMSADPARGLVFLPTSSPTVDFYGGDRPGNDGDASSIVALEATTGRKVWAFQTVHHNVWDYDVAAQPTLATLTLGGQRRDVVIVGTKTGFVFVLDRDTGAPVLPVEERPVPQNGAAGERLSPTQPFPKTLPPLVPQRLKPEDAYGLTPWDRGACRKLIESARSEGLYTPPSLQGTILFPSTAGGVNWGGVAVDPAGVVYVNTSRFAHLVRLFPAADYEKERAAHPGKEVSPMTGAPYGMMRDALLSPLGMPCNPPPWGVLAALDLNTGKFRWQSTLGTLESVHPLGHAKATGTPTIGGPLITRGGVLFIGATLDPYLRAFDMKTGRELWQGRLPTGAVATPMTYEWQGRQYVVIAAGGHGQIGIKPSDAVIAFALPAPGEAGPSLRSRTLDRPGGRFRAGVIGAMLGIVGLLWVIRRWRKRR